MTHSHTPHCLRHEPYRRVYQWSDHGPEAVPLRPHKQFANESLQPASYEKRSFSLQRFGPSAIDDEHPTRLVKKPGKGINVKFALDNMGFFTI